MDGLNLWRYVRSPILGRHLQEMHVLPHVGTRQVLGEKVGRVLCPIHLSYLQPLLRHGCLEPKVTGLQMPELAQDLRGE